MIVVTDTSVILNLAWLGQDTLLDRLFEKIIAPPEVDAEFHRLTRTDLRFQNLRFPAFVIILAPSHISPALAGNENLDSGEIAALSLALEQRVPDILIDERAGRAAAVALGLRPSGLLGVLLQAKRQSLIPALLPLLDRLRSGARFYIGDELRRQVASLAGETP